MLEPRRDAGGVGRGTTTPPSGPTGRVTVTSSSPTSDSSLTETAVLAKIQSAYMAGIRRCYRQGLTRDPSLTGTLDLSFTVTGAGRVADATCKGFDSEIDRCIEARATTWRFPVPTNPDGSVTSARFSFRLKLIPD